MKYKDILIFGFFFAIIGAIGAFSAEKGALILVNGSVSDAETGEPIGTNVFIYEPDGRVIRAKSNSESGVFHQPLVSGLKYKIAFDGCILPGNKQYFELEKFDSYEEVSKNFVVVKLKPGTNLVDIDVFKPNSDETIPGVDEKIETLQETLLRNRNAVVVVTVGAADSRFKAITKKVEIEEEDEKTSKKKRRRNKKKQYKTITIPPTDQMRDLADRRVKKLTELFEAHKIRQGRYEIVVDTDYGKDSAKSDLSPDVSIYIGKMYEY